MGRAEPSVQPGGGGEGGGGSYRMWELLLRRVCGGVVENEKSADGCTLGQHICKLQYVAPPS